MINWLKKNKIVALLILLLLFFIAKDYLPFYPLPGLRKTVSLKEEGLTTDEIIAPSSLGRGGLGFSLPAPEYAPTETEDRLVVEESSLSLVVKDVRQASDQVIDHAQKMGGYMVTTSLTNPEEDPIATVTVRVPGENLRAVLDEYRNLAVKVTSERIQGTDVTDEYVDLETRLATLEKTKAKFEEILDQATAVQDLLEVQRQLTYLQDQIDSLKGRQKYLEQTARLAKITVYLATDEYALPYAPAEAFRPKLIFKLAVRSLVTTLRSFAQALIWLGVYAVIWLPLVLIGFFIWKKRKT